MGGVNIGLCIGIGGIGGIVLVVILLMLGGDFFVLLMISDML